MGTLPIQPSWTSSTARPVLCEIDSAREPSLSVSVKPGRMLLMVMHGGSSLESDLAHDAIAPRRVFDSPMLSIGSLTDVEMMFTILPVPSASILGTRALVMVWDACTVK